MKGTSSNQFFASESRALV